MLKFWNKKDSDNKSQEGGVFKKLSDGLSKSSSKISGGISDILTKKKLDTETLEQLEELLIVSDLGPTAASSLIAKISKDRFEKEITEDEVKNALANEIEAILKPVEKQLVYEGDKPCVVLMVGVNGAGKTTAIGKMAHQLSSQGKKVMLAAGDTFRAAAVNQLKIWAERVDCEFFAKEEGADAAALAYEAIDKAIAEDVDVLFIDTAGRLQNKQGLMAELEKVYRVIGKKLPDAPHETIVILDATVGQNAHSQVELFGKTVNITGLVVTKLDGTAKGGVIISLAEKFKLPIYEIGIGEGISDLRPFIARNYARSLVGLEEIG